MSNTPKVNRDNAYEQPAPMPLTRSKRRPGKQLPTGGRDPRTGTPPRTSVNRRRVSR